MRSIFRSIKWCIRYTKVFDRFHNLFNYNDREQMLKISMEYVQQSNINGDYLEFGVYKGYTMSIAFNFAKKYKLNTMNFYAFDSFQGFPELKGVDKDGYQQFKGGTYKSDIDIFKKNLKSHGVNLKKVKIIPGFYDEVLGTLPGNFSNKASIIWVDCDLYESTVSVLKYAYDYIQEGTVIIFDDWNCYRGNPKRGEKRAFSEWLEEHPEILVEKFFSFGWHGNSFILNFK